MIDFLKRHSLLGAVAIGAGLLSVILYWPSLSLPVIYDDLLHIRIVKGLDLATVWLPTEEFGFYRPLTFLPLILIKQAFGYYPNWLLHGLNVAQHGLNVILLVILSWRLWPDPIRALITGLLFAFFPFSYQAIAVYGHNVHPATAGLILLGLHFYLSAISEQNPANGKRIWWGATRITFLLSLLSHESAILFGVFAALVHWNYYGEFPTIRLSFPAFRFQRIPPWFYFLVLGALYAIGYQFLPISRAPQAVTANDGGWWLRTLYVLQAAAYPLTWFAHRLPDLGSSLLVLSSTAITLGLTAWVARLRQNWLPLLLGWGWWGLASLLIMIPLPTNYLLHGPRLLYLSAVGLAFLWAQLLTRRKTGFPHQVWLLVGTSFILITNWQFVRNRLSQYGQLTNPIDEISMVMAERPPDEGIVVVNLPQWLSPPRNTYAVGAELVAMLGNYLFADEIVVQNMQGEHRVYPVVMPDLLQTPAYPYGIHDESVFIGDAAAKLPVRSDWAMRGSQVFVIRYPDVGPQTIHTGAFRKSDGEQSLLASFGSYELLEAESKLCDGSVQVTLVWKQPASVIPEPTASIFVQLLAEDGHLIAQADGPPLGLRPDATRLLPGWEIVDQRILQPEITGHPSQLLVGAYDFATGNRFDAYDSQSILLTDNAFHVPVIPCP
jgi:hypothetical protein